MHVENSMFFEDLAFIGLKPMYCPDSFFAWEGEGEGRRRRRRRRRGLP